jgi:hypothetical protein
MFQDHRAVVAMRWFGYQRASWASFRLPSLFMEGEFGPKYVEGIRSRIFAP